jgi:hypothetical protein
VKRKKAENEAERAFLFLIASIPRLRFVINLIFFCVSGILLVRGSLIARGD